MFVALYVFQSIQAAKAASYTLKHQTKKRLPPFGLRLLQRRGGKHLRAHPVGISQRSSYSLRKRLRQHVFYLPSYVRSRGVRTTYFTVISPRATTIIPRARPVEHTDKICSLRRVRRTCRIDSVLDTSTCKLLYIYTTQHLAPANTHTLHANHSNSDHSSLVLFE